MRYLVVGGAGLVGSHIRRALEGKDVLWTYHDAVTPGGLALDIRDAASVRRVVAEAHPDVIILAAASAFVEACELDPVGTRLVNVGGAASVAEEADRRGALLVVFSSEYVFAGCDPGGCAEDSRPAPINEYGRQKVEIEALARAVSRHLVCRTSGVFGREEKRRNFVAQLTDHLRAGLTFQVPSDQLITPTYAPSLAEAVVQLVEREQVGTFHVAGPRILARLEFAQMVAAAFGLPLRLVDARPTAELRLLAPRPLTTGLSTEKVHAVLGCGLEDPARALAEMARAEG